MIIGFWKKLWTWAKGKYHNLTHDHSKDRKDVSDKYEKIMKEGIFTLEKNINEKLTNEFCLFINDITNISSSYNTSYKDKLMGLIEHKNEFINIYKEFKEFIKKSFGEIF